MPSKPVTRARATPDETYRRVERIVGMMRRGEWKRGETAAILAEDWDLAENSVEHLAAEASRVVAREVVDPEGVKVDVATILLKDLERASAVSAFGDVARLGDVVTRIVGARAPEKVEHTVYAAMQPPQMLEAVQAQIAKLRTVEARLLAQMNVVQALSEGGRDE